MDLEEFKEYKESDKIINELCEIRGIGLWTAEFVMLRGLNKLESLPADDIGIKRVISHYYCDGRKITSDEALKYVVFGAEETLKPERFGALKHKVFGASKASFR